MATQETQQIDEVIRSRRAMLAMGGTALAGLAVAAMGTKALDAQTTITDTDILNFALNLEYLESNFYTLAVSGVLINDASFGVGITGTGTQGTVTTKGNNAYATCKVPFTVPAVQSYATEIAAEERNHVNDLRNALGTSAVAQPSLDLYNSFNALGALLGLASFDPFSNDLFFLLGSYIFEDVGVSAYAGAAPLIKDKVNVLPPAVGIHAVEAYHSAIIRTTLYALDQTTTAAGPAGTLQTLTQQISAARAMFDGTAGTTPDDIGVMVKSVPLEGAGAYPAVTVLDGDSNYLSWARTTTQVLNIVYASKTTVKGGFFPVGLNGTIA